MNKITRVLVLLAMLVGVQRVYAQERPVNIGLSLGASLHNIGGVDESKMRVGYDVALTLDYAFTNNLYLQTAFEFKNKGFKHKSLTRVADRTFFANQMYLQVPIYAAYKIDIAQGQRLFFNAGPYVGIGVGGKMKEQWGTDGWKTTNERSVFGAEGFKRWDFGLGFGAGIEKSGLVLHLNYELGLNNINKYNYILKDKIRNRNAVLSVGFKI